MIFAFGQRPRAAPCGALRNLSMKRPKRERSPHTLRKYLLGLPSGRLTETFAVLVQAETPQNSEDTTFVPLGITATTALCNGKFPSIPISQSEVSVIFRESNAIEDIFKTTSKDSKVAFWEYASIYTQPPTAPKTQLRSFRQRKRDPRPLYTWAEIIGSGPQIYESIIVIRLFTAIGRWGLMADAAVLTSSRRRSHCPSLSLGSYEDGVIFCLFQRLTKLLRSSNLTIQKTRVALYPCVVHCLCRKRCSDLRRDQSLTRQ